MSWRNQRIDDRLIHGQIVVAWGSALRLARLLVVDDEAAADDWERELLLSSAPGIAVSVARVVEGPAAWEAGRTAAGWGMVVVRDLRTARRLVEAGAGIPAFTIGGLHYAPGKTKLNEYVYLDEADREDARALLGRGVALEVQDVPASRPLPLLQLDPAVQP